MVSPFLSTTALSLLPAGQSEMARPSVLVFLGLPIAEHQAEFYKWDEINATASILLSLESLLSHLDFTPELALPETYSMI